MIEFPKTTLLAESILKVMNSTNSDMHNKDIDKSVAKLLELSTEQLSQVRLGKRTEYAYRMAWARQKLKQDKKILNIGKGYWKIL